MSQSRTTVSSSRRWIPKLLVTAVILAGVGGGAWYFKQTQSAPKEGAFRTASIERGNIRVAISATGTLSAISTVSVGSQISGLVTDVLVDFNDRVTRDQIVAKIDPSTYQAQIAQGSAAIESARASLAQAEATLRNNELDFNRKNALAQQKLVAQSDVDQARAALEQSRASVNSARAQINQQTASTQTSRLNMERTVIRSPVDGVVLMRTIEPGQTVAASLQAPELFRIAEDLSKMKIELSVDESDIGQVHPGQNVSFTVDAFPDRQFKGTVQQVRLSATTASNVVTFPVVVAVDNSDGTLLPGLTVNAEIEVSRRDNVLRLSNAALRYKPKSAVEGTASGSPAGGMRGDGKALVQALTNQVDAMKVSPEQRAQFDAVLAAMKERQEARQARQAPATGGPPGGMGGGGGQRMVMMSGGGANMEAQIRQRIAERFQQDFAEFTATLNDEQRQQWNKGLMEQLSAKRAPIFRLVNSKPEPVTVRIGASDGTNTEVISNDLKEGDTVVTGERATP